MSDITCDSCYHKAVIFFQERDALGTTGWHTLGARCDQHNRRRTANSEAILPRDVPPEPLNFGTYTVQMMDQATYIMTKLMES